MTIRGGVAEGDGARDLPLQDSYRMIASICLTDDRASLLGRLSIHDPVIRVWSLVRLLISEEGIPENIVKMALHVAPRSGHLRRVLHRVLLKAHRLELAEKVAVLEKERAPRAVWLSENLMRSRYACDFSAEVKCLTLLYLETGSQENLDEALDVALSRLSVNEGQSTILRFLFTRPTGFQSTCLAWLRRLQREGLQGDFESFATAIKPVKEARVGSALAVAQLLLWDGKPVPCLEFLERSNALKVTETQSAAFTNLAAMACEKIGDFRAAAHWYQKQNDVLKKKSPPPRRYIEDCQARGRLAIGALPEDSRRNFFIMTGFPRSGTTLLEHAIGLHPEIATCEETSSLTGTFRAVYANAVPNADDPELSRKAIEHRDLYYKNLLRHVRKPETKVVIDKTPIMSVNIQYMMKLFPSKKYIFSIRHPYDVVLSNWKQEYQQNVAMAAFNDIESACVLYDFTMMNWFSVFPGPTEQVCYVRYDKLVTEFEETVRSVLDFVGVGWSDQVREFAAASQERAVRTPSYAKVRKGLGLGVQSSWKDFDFLFDDRCRSLLDPWVERFGYAVR